MYSQTHTNSHEWAQFFEQAAQCLIMRFGKPSIGHCVSEEGGKRWGGMQINHESQSLREANIDRKLVKNRQS